MGFLVKKIKINYIAEWKSSQIHWSHKPVRKVRGCKSHFRNYSCGGQVKKPPFGKYQRRTIRKGRCRQMGIKFVLDVSLRRLQECKSLLTNNTLILNAKSFCGGQNKKPPFGKYQRRTIRKGRCRQMGIKFVLDVSLRRLQ